MLLLTTTLDVLRVMTGTAVTTIGVHASWVDNMSSTITPGSSRANITTAATTTIVAAPAAATQRNIKGVSIENNHASASTQITVQNFDGTSAYDLISVTLLAGEKLSLDENGEWHHRDSQGAEYSYAGPAFVNLGITGTLAETMPRETCPEVNTAAPTASGTLFLQAIYLKAGQLVSNITISSATTAAGTPTNYFFALYSGALARLAVSANQTTTAWAANTVKTLAMATPYRVPVSGLYYIGIMMTATTVVTTKGGTAKTGGQLAGAVPILHGASSPGLTTAMPDPAAAITAGLVTLYAAVS